MSEREAELAEASAEVVDLFLAGKPADAKAKFDHVVTAKVNDKLVAKRAEIAAGIFAEAEDGGEKDEEAGEEAGDDDLELTPEEQEFLDSLTDEEIEELINAEDDEDGDVSDEDAGDELDEMFNAVDITLDMIEKGEISEAELHSHYDNVQEFLEQYENPAMEKKEVVLSEDWDKMSHEAKELVLHADNDHQMHRSSHEPIMRNLRKKAVKGKYDHEKAKKLWGYHADRAAQTYTQQHGDKHTPWHKAFSPSARKEAAKHWADMHKDDHFEKHSHYDGPASPKGGYGY
jgi:hypothetical protein